MNHLYRRPSATRAPLDLLEPDAVPSRTSGSEGASARQRAGATRLTTRHVAVLVATMLTGSALVAPPALADNIFGDVHCGQTPSPACQIAAGTRPNRPAADNHHTDPGVNDESGSTGNDFGCRYVPVDYPAPSGPTPEPGGWFMVLCSPDGKDPDSHGPVWVPAGANAPTVSPEQVAQTARK